MRLKWTNCFLKQATSCSIELRSVLSTTRSSDDELSSCDWRFNCCRCLRCSRREVLDGVLRLWRLSRERGDSDPFWLSGELLVFWNRRLRRRVARAGSWDLKWRWIWIRNETMWDCLDSHSVRRLWNFWKQLTS
jgi:hypothetical protein